MLIFTDETAQDNPGLTRSKQGLKNVPIKKVKTISSRGASFEGELEAIYMGTEYAKDNPSSSNNNCHIYTDSQAAIKAIIGQSRESYHNTINIRENLMNICQTVDETKLVYCPAHKGMAENETSASKV